MEGRTLWSAVKQRKESEERVRAMRNRIRKLELDQSRMNRSLILMSSKSQKVLDCRKQHRDVSNLTRIAFEGAREVQRNRIFEAVRKDTKVYEGQS